MSEMTMPVSVDSRMPLFLKVDLRGLANIYAQLSATEQATFFQLVDEELRVVCNRDGRQLDWFQRDNIAIEVSNNPAALEFVKYIGSLSGKQPDEFPDKDGFMVIENVQRAVA